MTTTAEPATRPETATAVLAAARVQRRNADAAEAALLQLAVDWAAMHAPDSIHPAATLATRCFGDTDLPIAGPGAPSVAEFCVAEFAVAIGLSHEAGKRFLGEAVETCHRLPRVWRRVHRGDLPAWKARSIARETLTLSVEGAEFVDRHVAPVAHKVRPAQLQRLVEEAIARFMPERVAQTAQDSWDRRHVTLQDQLVSFTGTMHLDADLDLADALDLDDALTAGAAALAALGSTESLDVRRAQALGDLARGQSALDLTTDPAATAPRRQLVLHVHLSQAALTGGDPVAHLERGNALVTVEQVRTWCGHPDTQVVVKPVIDLATCVEADSDTVTDQIAEHVALRDRTCVFPWCTRPARRCHPDDHGCDGDHIEPRARGGPTCTCNIAPLCRRHHRLKTHGRWRYYVLEPGRYLWTSPHGYQFLRDHTGTTDLTPDRTVPSHPPDR